MVENAIVDVGSLEEVCHFAEEAGRRIMPFYRSTIQVTAKADQSPLTEADLASHEYLTSALAGAPVLSEESGVEDAPLGRHWLVDPLDGTKEFLKGTDEFTVNIALMENGYPILGVVHAPALDLTYCAAPSVGAWLRRGPRIATRRARRSHLSIVASKDHAGPMVQELLQRHPTAELRSMGSSLKFCLVAAGEADVYLRDVPTMEWDTAAAQCVVESAGGVVCTLDGKRLRYGKSGLRNPSILTLGDASALSWALEGLDKVT